jgi:hypothetical protein
MSARKLFLLFVLFTAIQNGSSRTTKGREFWIGFMENLTLAFNGPPVFKIQISSAVTTTCNLTIPQTGYVSTFVVNGNQTYEYFLPQGNFNPFGDESFANNGIRITFTDSVEVRAFHYRTCFSESTIILPIGELGTEYMVMAHFDQLGKSPSEFMVLATQNTVIQIIPSAITAGTRPAGVAFTVSIMQGQMYQIQSFTDLTGTMVKSLNAGVKIAVFGGARQAIVGCNSGADDHLYEQVYPLTSAGKIFHIAAFSGHLFDVVKILATRNNTTVNISCHGQAWMQKGQSTTFTLNSSCEIIASDPIFVSQLATSNSCNGAQQQYEGDPGMINLVSSDLMLKKSVFYTLPSVKFNTDYFEKHRLNIVVRNSAIGLLKLDNIALPTNSFSSVAPGSGYSYARVVLDTLSILQHTLSCDSGFNAIVYGFGFFSFYGHHLGYNNPEVNTIGITELNKENMFSVFPNPVVTELNFSSGGESISRVTIVDLLGNTVVEVYDLDLIAPKVNIGKLEDGVYYCVIHTEPFRFAQLHSQKVEGKDRVIKFVKVGKK